MLSTPPAPWANLLCRQVSRLPQENPAYRHLPPAFLLRYLRKGEKNIRPEKAAKGRRRRRRRTWPGCKEYGWRFPHTFCLHVYKYFLFHPRHSLPFQCRPSFQSLHHPSEVRHPSAVHQPSVACQSA